MHTTLKSATNRYVGKVLLSIVSCPFMLLPAFLWAADFTGNYTGSWTDIYGSGSLTAPITQTGSTLSGKLTITDTACGNFSNLTLAGSVSGSTASFNASATCPYDKSYNELRFTNGVLSGNTITGSFAIYSNGSFYSSGSFTLTRPAPCTYSLSQTSKSFTYSGGTASFTVTSSSSSCTWSASSNDSWLTISSGSSGTGNGTVNYSVSANSATNLRTGTMTIAGQTFTVTQDALQQYTVTVSKTGSGNGTITSSLLGINCGSDCFENYASGTSVTLTAAADASSTFTGWSGGGCSGTGACTLTMDASKNVTATFVLSDSTPPTGSITINSGATYTNSTAVTLTLSCTDTGGCSQMSFSNDNLNWSTAETNATTKSWNLFSGDGAKTVYVKFKDGAGNWSPAYNDKITLDTTAPTTTPSVSGGTYTSAQSVSLSSEAGATIYYTTDGTDPTMSGTRVQYADTPISITSTITLKYYTVDAAGNASAVQTGTYAINYPLSVSKSGTGSGTVSSNPSGINCGSDCSENYASGTSVILTAIPSSDSLFTGWSGACSGTSSTCTVVMGSAKTVIATLVPYCSYTLSLTGKAFSVSSGADAVSITTSFGDCAWTAAVASDASSWVTITSGSSGTGNGTVNYSVSANTGASARTGIVTIAGQAFVIAQAGTGESVHLLSLTSGWNLISLPLQPSNTAIANVLSSISGKYSIVWSYVAGQWKVYDPSDIEGSTISTMDAGKGYWIKAGETQSLSIGGGSAPTSLALPAGWNLAGFNKTANASASSVLSSISGKYSILWSYVAGQWKVYDPSDIEGSTLTNFQTGNGYWIKIDDTNGATLVFP